MVQDISIAVTKHPFEPLLSPRILLTKLDISSCSYQRLKYILFLRLISHFFWPENKAGILKTIRIDYNPLFFFKYKSYGEDHGQRIEPFTAFLYNWRFSIIGYTWSEPRRLWISMSRRGLSDIKASGSHRENINNWMHGACISWKYCTNGSEYSFC
jgi:hypothetical protein